MLLIRINRDALARDLARCGWKIDDLRQASELSWGTLAKVSRGEALSPESAHKIGLALAGELKEAVTEVLDRLLETPAERIPA